MALSCLAELFTDDHTVAAYEVQSSGIVSSLLTGLCPDDSLLSKKLIQERITLFKQAFALHPLRFASRRQRQQLRVFYLKESFTVLPRSNDTKPHILYTFILDRRVHWIDVYIGYCCFYSGCNLVAKLIAVLESIEKLPIYSYDANSSTHYGLQILHRRLRFKLERSDKEASLIDRTGMSLNSPTRS